MVKQVVKCSDINAKHVVYHLVFRFLSLRKLNKMLKHNPFLVMVPTMTPFLLSSKLAYRIRSRISVICTSMLPTALPKKWNTATFLRDQTVSAVWNRVDFRMLYPNLRKNAKYQAECVHNLHSQTSLSVCLPFRDFISYIIKNSYSRYYQSISSQVALHDELRARWPV